MRRGCLSEAGASLRDVVLPPQFAELVDAQIAIMVHEVAKSLSYERLVHRASLSVDMIAMIDAGLAVSPARYDAARVLAQGSRSMLAEVFADVDVLLAPSAIGEAPHGIAATGDPLFNRMWTLLHTPCVHLPSRNRAARIAGRHHDRGADRRRSCDVAGRGLDSCAAWSLRLTQLRPRRGDR